MKPSRSAVGGTTASPVHSLSADQKASSESSILPPPEICYEHTHEGVFTRTGWLMRQTLSKDWSRHWFVLRDSSLTYYRDPSAENSGIMDGILDLNQVSTIRDTDSDRYYAFSLRMWDSKKHVLAAESDDFRSMWIQALQYASNLWSSASKEDFICSEIVLPEHTYHTDRSGDRISSPSSLSSLPYNGTMETSYTSSDDQSEYFSLVDEDEISDLSSSPRTLPPSPPINRNMISLVKEKSRIRSSSGIKASTPPTGTESSLGHSLDESHNSTFSHYKDAIDSMLLEKDKNSLDSSRETKEGDRRISPTKSVAVSPENCLEDVENIQFSLEFEDQVCKEEHFIERDYDGHVESACNSLPSESSGVSISDSKNTDECQRCLFVKSKLVAAKEEIRRLKKELKEAHANFDNLEMYSYKLKQDIKVKEDSYTSQIALMTAKIDDLTSKFTLAEKNYRQLKQKNLKSENKERKRSSLKSKEALSLTKEYELKLCDLEKKIDYIETNLQRESPDEDSKILQLLTKPEGCSSLSESDDVCDTSASTDVSSTNSVQGFFSRLQSLGSKVETVNTRISESSASSPEHENPKIRLEAAMDGFSRVDDSDDSLPRSSSNNSIECLDLYLNGSSEYQRIILRKIDKILKWLNSSLNVACRDGNENSNIEGGKLLMLKSLVDSLSPFCLSNSSNLLDSEQLKTSHAVMLVYKVVWFLERIVDIDSFDCLIKLNITQLAFKALIRTLCITFAEYENSEMTNVLRFISEVPQLRYFCPIVNSLFPNSQEEIAQFSLVSERLQQLNDEQNNILNTIQTAKKLRYECLWNTLTDIPVQDAGVNRTQKGNSILNYVTSIATYIYRIADVQLLNVPCPSSYMFKIEQEKVRDWSSAANVSLKDDLAAFLSELKDQCPMLHESSVLVSELCETKRKEITSYVTELSFFSVSFSVLSSLLSCLPTVSENCQFSSEDLVHHFDGGLEHLESKQFFNCPQCATLNGLLSSSEQAMSWPACVEKYKFYNSRKCDCFSYSLDNVSCINCGDPKESGASSNKDVCNNLTCVECDNWINKFLASEKQHELERQALELKYNKELEQLEDCLIKSSEVHEQEMLQKESELESTTAQLQSLKLEYEEQVKTLKNLYEQKLHFDCENIEEESLRQVYKAEVEDLKDMFKKGLAAIENSHYRITTELEKRHQEEINALAQEKEKALEIEAQATVTALEAIKKSHEQQLKEETAHIKAELMKKFQLGQEYETFYSKYGGDLEKLKDEIVHITEMYSEKCMENIALEEKVSSLRYQLEEAHGELCGLLKKNKEMDLSYVNVC